MSGLGGRWREAERNDRALLQAAREVISEQGAEAPVSEIARRAGVGVASFYRRFATKDLLLERLCLTAAAELAAAAEMAVAAPDTRHGIRRLVERASEQRLGALLALAPRAVDSERTRAEFDASVVRATASLDELVSRGRAAGAVRNDLTGADLVQVISRFSRNVGGPAHYRGLGLLLDGMFHGDPRPLPGPEPAWSDVFDQ